MAKFIVKVPFDGVDYYMNWSTVTDSPSSYGLQLNEFIEEHSPCPERMARVDIYGSSSLRGESMEDIVAGNRAGPGESELSLGQLILAFVDVGD